jgi:hypothetical protein
VTFSRLAIVIQHSASQATAGVILFKRTSFGRARPIDCGDDMALRALS